MSDLNDFHRNAADPAYFSPMGDYPWKTLTVKLTRQKPRKTHSWLQEPQVTRLLVAVPHTLLKDHNIAVVAETRVGRQVMLIGAGAAPAFSKFKSESSVEYLAYFDWLPVA